MRSIRLALSVYVLALLALALGAVAGLLYRTAAQSLRAREETTAELLRAGYEERCRLVREDFDKRLLARAQDLATLAQGQWAAAGRAPELAALSLLGAPAGPHGHLLIAPWAAVAADATHDARPRRDAVPRAKAAGLVTALAGPAGPLGALPWAGDALDGRLAARLRLERVPHLLPAELAEHEGDDGPDYFQVYTEAGRPLLRTPALADAGFALSRADREGLRLLQPSYDDPEVRPGVRLRRVTLKVPVARRGPRLGAGWRGPAGRAVPAMFVQCAIETGPRDRDLERLEAGLRHDLADRDAEAAASLAALRQRLWWVALATFAAATAGACGLIAVGLAPLRRLSEALGRVSERDFRLHFNPTRLPAELRPIVDRLAQTFAQLERAFAREKQAAADISHELRTPLAALLTTVEVARRKPRTPEHYAAVLADCESLGRQMSRMVERLLALARLDAGADTVRPREVDVAELAARCLAVVRPLAEARGLTLALHAPGPAPLTADPDKLAEVLTNLLHNAIEYNRPAGRVDVRVERHNGRLHLAVQDTGVGIDPEARAHVFERFYRADRARQGDGLHAGLGLAIVKAYVDLMGGSVAVESTPGVGTAFHIDLPTTSP